MIQDHINMIKISKKRRPDDSHKKKQSEEDTELEQ